MDTMSVRKIKTWQYYKQVSDYELRCLMCRKTYFPINCSNFYKHIIGYHSEIVNYEETCGRQEWPWICFKYIYKDTITLECLFCLQNFQSDFQSLAEHLSREHFSEVKNYVYHDWIWKYYYTNIVDSCKVKCICKDEYEIVLNKHLHQHIKYAHLKELRNVQITHEIVLSTTSVEYSKVVELKENIYEYYKINKLLQVKCEFCEYNCSYIQYSSENSDLHRHIEEEHKKIFEWEKDYEVKKNRPLWTNYYIFVSDENIVYPKCRYCHNLFSFSTAQNHLQEHSKDIKPNALSDDWIFKYYTQTSGDKIKCNICYNNMNILVEPNVFNHIIEKHSKELQSNISSKKYKKLRQNYKDLQNFLARCNFCEFQSYYIDTRNFSEHINEKHEKIKKYEEERGERLPFKFFKYINETILQCCICNDSVAFKECQLTDHLKEKHFIEPHYFIDCGWIWKYCTKVGDFEVKCSNCLTTISLDIPLWFFNYHTIDKYLKTQQYNRTQRPLDVAGSSGSQSN